MEKQAPTKAVEDALKRADAIKDTGPSLVEKLAQAQPPWKHEGLKPPPLFVAKNNPGPHAQKSSAHPHSPQPSFPTPPTAAAGTATDIYGAWNGEAAVFNININSLTLLDDLLDE